MTDAEGAVILRTTHRNRRGMAEHPENDSIERYRREIDSIDTQLLEMLNRRAACAISIGKIKKRNNLPIHVPEREQEVLERLIAKNAGPVTAESVRHVFQTIFDQMKALERAGGTERGDD